jgi:hypothetical protein
MTNDSIQQYLGVRGFITHNFPGNHRFTTYNLLLRRSVFSFLILSSTSSTFANCS